MKLEKLKMEVKKIINDFNKLMTDYDMKYHTIFYWINIRETRISMWDIEIWNYYGDWEFYIVSKDWYCWEKEVEQRLKKFKEKYKLEKKGFIKQQKIRRESSI